MASEDAAGKLNPSHKLHLLSSAQHADDWSEEFVGKLRLGQLAK
jgi:hypothetical protein